MIETKEIQSQNMVIGAAEVLPSEVLSSQAPEMETQTVKPVVQQPIQPLSEHIVGDQIQAKLDTKQVGADSVDVSTNASVSVSKTWRNLLLSKKRGAELPN
jgi:hypothetical protein